MKRKYRYTYFSKFFGHETTCEDYRDNITHVAEKRNGNSGESEYLIEGETTTLFKKEGKNNFLCPIIKKETLPLKGILNDIVNDKRFEIDCEFDALDEFIGKLPDNISEKTVSEIYDKIQESFQGETLSYLVEELENEFEEEIES